MSRWKIQHPSDTEDDCAVGLTSEDEAEGLEPTPGVARRSFGGPPAPEVQPAPIRSTTPSAAGDEVVVKKRALKLVKQQVSALLCGEDLPEGVHRPGRLLRCHMKSQLSLEERPPVLCASRSSSLTTE